MWLQKILALLPGQDAQARSRMYRSIREYGARSLDCYDLTQPRRPLSATEVRGLATGAILAFRGNEPLRALPSPRPAALAEGKENLAQWWGITNTAEAIERLERLHYAGHRQELHPQLQSQPERWHAVFRANPFLAKRLVTSVAAWDYARLVNVARWCYDYGYLNWEQAWPFIDAATRLGLRDFYSWESFATSFVAGRLMWNPTLESHAEVAKITTFLVDSPHSPWRSLPWQPYPVD